MGNYKVPQNVEAEDKILGPLSMKQFIYALIGIGYGLLMFAILKPISIILWVIIGVPPMLALLALGLYQRQDQSLETFVIAVAEFFVRPRIRYWQKEPIADAFRLEPPPPKPEMAKRDPRKVHSQLAQLADVVDTRGWSIKEPELQEPDEMPVIDLQDRLGGKALAGPGAFTAPVEVTQADDILSPQTANARGLNTLIQNSVTSLRQEALENMLHPPAATAPTPSKPAATAKTAKTSAKKSAAATPSISGSTAAPSGAILKLATEGGDLTVAQIAAQARRQTTNPGEGQSVNLSHADAAKA